MKGFQGVDRKYEKKPLLVTFIAGDVLEFIMKITFFSSYRQSVSTKLYVGNLPETCRRADLLSEFDKYGKVVECDIVNNYAFVVSMTH